MGKIEQGWAVWKRRTFLSRSYLAVFKATFLFLLSLLQLGDCVGKKRIFNEELLR
jgi:hypothetical protein